MEALRLLLLLLPNHAPLGPGEDLYVADRISVIRGSVPHPPRCPLPQAGSATDYRLLFPPTSHLLPCPWPWPQIKGLPAWIWVQAGVHYRPVARPSISPSRLRLGRHQGLQETSHRPSALMILLLPSVCMVSLAKPFLQILR